MKRLWSDNTMLTESLIFYRYQDPLMSVFNYFYLKNWIFLHSAAGFVTEKTVAKTFGLLEMIMRKIICFQWNRDSKFVSQIGL